MNLLFLMCGVALILLMLPLLWRAAVGPTVIDRIISVNIIGTKTTVVLIVVGALFDRMDMFVDLALTYALLNFLAVIAAARLIERTGVPPGGEETV